MNFIALKEEFKIYRRFEAVAKPLRLFKIGWALIIFGLGCSASSTLSPASHHGSVVAATGSVPKHVLTWAYDGAGSGGMGASAPQVQAFTNWAEERTQTPPGKAEHDCYPGAGPVGCQAVWYLDASLLHSQLAPDKYLIAQLNAERLPDDAGFYHNRVRTAGDRVVNTGGPNTAKCEPSEQGPCYYDNLSDKHVIAFATNCLLQGGSGSTCGNLKFYGPIAGTELFKDDNPGLCENKNGIGDYFKGGSTTFTPSELGPEPECDPNLQKSTLTFLAALKYSNGTQARSFLNGYAPLCGNETCAYPTGDATYWTKAPVSALGITDEGSVCPSATSPTVGFTGAIVMDDVAQLFNEAPSGYFILLNYSTAPAGSEAQLRMRRYCDGIFWLGYDSHRSVLWSNYSNGNRTLANENILAVYPEQQIVPMNPVETMTDVTTSTFGYNGTGCDASGRFDPTMRGGAADLVVACGPGANSMVAGVYVRQFHLCYSWGSLIGGGQCAVVVNMTDESLSIGGSTGSPWRYQNGDRALSLGYNELLRLSGQDVVTDNCSVVFGCRTGKGTDLDFAGSFVMYGTAIAPGDAAFLFHT